MRNILIWTALLASLFIAFQNDCCCNAALDFNDRADFNPPQSNAPDWMASIDDSKMISHITIPGSHDTMALYGGPAAICQAWTLKDQLMAGIRYLDIRTTAYFGPLSCMHGPMYQKATFADVINIVQDFLKDHKRETVLLRVKPENLLFKGRVKEKVQRVIQGYDNIIVTSNIPTMGEARGKIVFVQKGQFDLGIPIHSTDKAGDYKVVDIGNKKDKILIHLKEAMNQCGRDKVILSYSSGTGFGTLKGMLLSPKCVAREVNPWLCNYLKDLEKNILRAESCFGVIAMDFPGFDLIQTVIELNR
ncbi:1-phosphatidylinositol phosphodiesterase-like [Alosa sapidissima]|uniref:1-phosphatidylinositol phosphodiesterase-like n=1 Tax=Alosa sapidissima TaxID=34773 RepID=UPI001C082430|nr:1-phosphatidylinositol phosphodiesterase-like [Alosa sapidissima]